MRQVWVTVGIGALALGGAGLILPLLPTTPFLLVAAWAFARSSPRLHHWLITHPRLGPAISDWQEDGVISPRAKVAAIFAIGVSILVSLVLGVAGGILAVQAVVLTAVSVFILTRRSNRCAGSEAANAAEAGRIRSLDGRDTGWPGTSPRDQNNPHG